MDNRSQISQELLALVMSNIWGNFHPQLVYQDDLLTVNFYDKDNNYLTVAEYHEDDFDNLEEMAKAITDFYEEIHKEG